jgi:hypothetical protein
MSLPYMMAGAGDAEIEVSRDTDTVRVAIATETTEHVDLTPDQAAELAHVLLTLAGRNEQ